jgi:hypothetical protein
MIRSRRDPACGMKSSAGCPPIVKAKLNVYQAKLNIYQMNRKKNKDE